MDEQLLTVEDIARLCVVPEQSVYGWIHKGTAPPSIRVGRYRRFRRADVEKWLESRTDRPQTQAS